MSNFKDGGPVFPDGMTLRDWFAGQAIASIIQAEIENSKFELLNSGFKAAIQYDEDGQLICACPQTNDLSDDWESWTEVAKSSYALADAMLRERNCKEASK